MKESTIYEKALEEIKELCLDEYYTEFLAQLVTQKIKHPEAHIDVLTRKVMKKIPMAFFDEPKVKIVTVSSEKMLENLEVILEASDKVPTEMLELGGENVSSVVKFFSKKVFEELANE